MRKILLVLLFLLAISLCHAQQSFLFKIKYLPDHSYETNIALNSDMQMNIAGSPEEMQRIKAKGVKSPILVVSTTKMDIDAETGSLDTGGYFPMTMLYKNITARKAVNGVEAPAIANPLLGQSIFCRYSKDGRIQIDSISGKTVSDDIKKVLATAIGNLTNQLKFPDHPMKIGESFTQEEPFDLPLAGINMSFAIKIIYKLTSVEGNLAYFDMDESMNMDMLTQKGKTNITMNGIAAGNGKLVYDINESYSILRNSNLKMDYKMLMGDLSMSGNAHISASYQTDILRKAK